MVFLTMDCVSACYGEDAHFVPVGFAFCAILACNLMQNSMPFDVECRVIRCRLKACGGVEVGSEGCFHLLPAYKQSDLTAVSITFARSDDILMFPLCHER